MKKSSKIILIAAGAAILAGSMISAAAVTMGAGKSDSVISHRKEVITDKITSLNISLKYGDIAVIPGDTDTISVQCAESETQKYSILSQNGTLTIENAQHNGKKLKWYEHISFNFFDDESSRRIVVTVPRDFEADMSIKNSCGGVNVSGVKGNLNTELNYGDLEIENCLFTSLNCTADYGDIEIERTSAQNITVSNDCGDIYFEDVAGNIMSECDFGDTEFRYISGDNLIFSSSCGDIEGIIHGQRTEYEGGTKKLETNIDMGDVKISFTE